MEVILSIVLVIAGVSIYDYMAARKWQQVTSVERNNIVFENRNKNYGAYVLRRDYDKRMVFIMLGVVLAMGITFAVYKFIQSIPEEVIPEPPVQEIPFDTTPVPPEDDMPPPPPEEVPPPQEATVLFPPPIIVDVEVTDPPPTTEDLGKKDAGLENKDGSETFDDPTVFNEPVKKDETVKTVEEPILEFIEEDATFPGGPAEMQKWINNNVKYPQTSLEFGEHGTVFLSFVVEPDGSISGVQVEKGVSDDLDKEAKRLVRSMPRWKPGKNNGKAVRARCRLPVKFAISG